MLKIKDLNVHYGKAHVLKGVDIHVPTNQIVAVLGPNGAGKTTLVSTISCLKKPSSGEILFNGRPIHREKTQNVVRAGLIHVPQGRQLFRAMTVRENLEMGAFLGRRLDKLELVYSLFPRLKERSNQKAGTLSGGEAQMVAIGRGLMSTPNLLLLDEPTLGLAPLLIQSLKDSIARICETGVSILLVEQNAKMALDIAQQAYVLQLGTIFLHGKAEDLKAGGFVKKAYLGGD